jgi:hypothetical protein
MFSLRGQEICLSSIYNARLRWALVYSIDPGSSTVEFVADRFFATEKKAWRWFHKHHKIENFIDPKAVMVSGFHKLTISQ